MGTHITQALLPVTVPCAAECGTLLQSTDSIAHHVRGPGQALGYYGERECPSTRSSLFSQELPLYLITMGVVRRGSEGSVMQTPPRESEEWGESCPPHMLVTLCQGHLCVTRGRFWSEPWASAFPSEP